VPGTRTDEQKKRFMRGAENSRIDLRSGRKVVVYVVSATAGRLDQITSTEAFMIALAKEKRYWIVFCQLR